MQGQKFVNTAIYGFYLSQNASSPDTFVWKSPVLNFLQTGWKSRKYKKNLIGVLK